MSIRGLSVSFFCTVCVCSNFMLSSMCNNNSKRWASHKDLLDPYILFHYFTNKISLALYVFLWTLKAGAQAMLIRNDSPKSFLDVQLEKDPPTEILLWTSELVPHLRLPSKTLSYGHYGLRMDFIKQNVFYKFIGRVPTHHQPSSALAFYLFSPHFT